MNKNGSRKPPSYQAHSLSKWRQSVYFVLKTAEIVMQYDVSNVLNGSIQNALIFLKRGNQTIVHEKDEIVNDVEKMELINPKTKRKIRM